MNDLVFNNKSYPLYVTSNSFMTAARSGDAYVTTANLALSLALVGGGTALMLSNPSTSKKQIVIQQISVAALAGVLPTVRIIKDGTLNGTGTAATTTNTNFGSSNTTVASNRFIAITAIAGPVTGGTIIETATSIASVFSSMFVGAIIVPPGHTIAISITVNATGLTLNMDAEIVYWEEDL